MACSTRSETRHSVFGDPKELPVNVLPLAMDVLQCYRYHQIANVGVSGNDLFKIVTKQVRDVYTRASIPTMEYESILKKVKRLVQKANDLQKYSVSKKSSTTYTETVQKFATLFDVCTCRCVDSGIINRDRCNCPLDQKIPSVEWDFWVDQKTSRHMIIGNLDKKVTSKFRKVEERIEKGAQYRDKAQKEMHHIAGESEASCSEENNDDGAGSFVPSEDDETYSPQNRNKYPELCRAIERSNVSNRDACLIINAALKDLGLLSWRNAIDPSKLQRQRKYWREKSSSEHQVLNEAIVCLGFDGRSDQTLIVSGKLRRKVTEEHYVLLDFPSRRYVDHIAQVSGKSEDIFKEIISVIETTKSEESLKAIVCDGAVVNTGKTNGVIRKLEQQLHRPLQWLICMLHANELPLRKLVEVVDGRTSGPQSNVGLISKLLSFEPETKPIVTFTPIPGFVTDIPEAIKKDFSCDQSYLLRICLLVQQGLQVDEENLQFLQTAQPGPLNHARWITKANRLLRHYISQENPLKRLIRLTRFVVNFYAPAWFYIKIIHHLKKVPGIISSCCHCIRN